MAFAVAAVTAGVVAVPTPASPPALDLGSATTAPVPSTAAAAVVASRRAYAGQDADDALRTLRRWDRGLLTPVWHGVRLRVGQRVARYLGAYHALIEQPDGSRTLAASTMPLVVGGSGGGAPVPVDLSLRPVDGGFRPAHPLVDVRFPADLRQGLTLAADHVTVLPRAVAAPADGVSLTGGVFWANVARDTDWLARPVPSGFEVSAVLRSEDSPESIPMTFALPPGAVLRRGPGGRTDVVRGGRTLAVVSQAWAWDAAGHSVEVTQRVAGDELTLSVAHRGAGLRYPITIDPMVQDYRYWSSNGSLDDNDWTREPAGDDGYFDNELASWSDGRGLYSWASRSQSYPDARTARWYSPALPPGLQTAPAKKFVYAVDFYGVTTHPSSSCLRVGIYSLWGGRWEAARINCGASSGLTYSICLAPDCPTTEGDDGNYAEFETVVSGTAFRNGGFGNYLGGALVYENDITPPTLTASFVHAPSGWIDNTHLTVATSTFDRYGLGVKNVTRDAPGLPQAADTQPCDGTHQALCPNTTDHDFDVDVGGMSEGDDTITVTAADILGNATTKTLAVRVDHSAPVLTLSGSLYANRGRTLDNGAYALHVDARDGTPSVPASGVRDLTVTVDDTPQTVAPQTCSGDSCALSLDYAFATAAQLPGPHTVAVVATDQLGHEARTSFTVTVADPASCRGGYVDAGHGVAPVTVSGQQLCQVRNTAPASTDDKHLAASARLRIDGSQAGEAAGSTVADAGDVNGDGIADLLVGAPYGATSGWAYVVFGQANPEDVDLQRLAGRGFAIYGGSAYARFGATVTGVGDLNGDGLSDVAIGAPEDDTSGRADNGSVYVVFGKSTTTPVYAYGSNYQGYRIDGVASWDEAGTSIAALPDVTGDGRQELVIGSPSASVSGKYYAGAAHVVFGKSSNTPVDLAALGAGGFRINGTSYYRDLGESVGAVPDLNGDGKAELLVDEPGGGSVGAPSAGNVFVIFGTAGTATIDTGALGSAGYRIAATAASGRPGDAMTGVGDLTGDGIPDIAIGVPDATFNGRSHSGGVQVAPGQAGTGQVTLGTAGYEIDGAAANDRLGAALADVGDVNDDGADDLLVGAPSAGSPAESGLAYVVYGQHPPAGPVDLSLGGAWGFKVDGDGGRFGAAVAAVGDVDADGALDFAVGEPDASPRQKSQAGSVLVATRSAGDTTDEMTTRAQRTANATANGGGDTYTCQFTGLAQGTPMASVLSDVRTLTFFASRSGTYNLQGTAVCVHGENDPGEASDDTVYDLDLYSYGEYTQEACGTGSFRSYPGSTSLTPHGTVPAFEGPLYLDYDIELFGNAGPMSISSARNAERVTNSGEGAAALDPVVGDCVTNDMSQFRLRGTFRIDLT